MHGLTPGRCTLTPGRCSYRANVSESVVGTIASLEHALDSFEDRLRERETDLAQSQRQSADLAKQLDQPFEHEEKLSAASERQQEIVSALDITKNQASASVAAEEGDLKLGGPETNQPSSIAHSFAV